MDFWIGVAAWLTGIYSSYQIYFGIILFLLSAVFFSVLPERETYTRPAIVFLLIALAGFGYGSRRIPYDPPAISKPVSIRGIVKEREQKKDGGYRYEIVIEEPKKLQGNRYIVYDSRRIIPGTTVINRAVLEKSEVPPHPFGFREDIYFLGQNISYKGRSLFLKPEKGPSEFAQLKETIRKRAAFTLKPFNEREKQLFNSMLLGNRGTMGEEISEELKDFGLGHILAISGLHMGIFTGFLYGIFYFLFRDKKFAENIGLFLSFLYLWVTDFPLSGLRVWLILTAAILLKRRRLPWNLPMVPGIVMVLQTLLYPGSIFSLSFWLSYGAYFGLLIMPKRLGHYFYPYNRGIFKGLIATLGVHIFILPVLLYIEPVLRLSHLAGNIFLLPLYSLFITMGFFHIIVGGLFGIIVRPWVFGIRLLSELIFKLEDLLAPLIAVKISFPKPDLTIILIYYFFLSLWLTSDRDILPKGKWKRAFNLGFAIFIFVSAFHMYQEYVTPKIHFIYVGQGDSTLIRDRGRTLLIDTGGSHNPDYRPGKKYTLPYLEGIGIGKLDGVILTHFDSDHADGLFDLIDKIPVHRVYAGRIPDPEFPSEKLNRQGIPLVPLKRGDAFHLADGKLAVLSAGLSESDSENNRSLVLEGEMRGFRFLFPGDGEKELEDALGDVLRPVHVYHVAHHGSKTSSSPEFLDRLKSKVAVISCGRNNEYGHPHQEVLDRLESRGMNILRTDLDGTVVGVIGDNLEFYNYESVVPRVDRLIVYGIAYYIYLQILKKGLAEEDVRLQLRGKI